MVSVEEVESVADNARIKMGEEEAEKFASEFEEILEMFEALDEIDTEGVEPAFHPIDTESESRRDERQETLSREEVFANTENEKEGFFKGPSA
ncbi:MAG: Asp-tRNA(Asn)/Glu-tRNA(Gln) amidotransferase subunit GatC [Candidatus Nanohalobium sp.]